MNRRDYLKSLLALGASFTLPAVGSFPTEQASPALIDALGDQSVDAIWKQGVDLFEVDDNGTISFADVHNPLFRGDYYAYALSIGPREINCLDLVDTSQPTELGNRLQALYNDYRSALVAKMANPSKLAESRQFERQLSRMPRDLDCGWITWMEAEPKEAKEVYADAIAAYLEELPDFCNNHDWLPDESTDRGAAYRYFLREEGSVLLDRLGVVLVEGEHPGSSYFAAELHVPIEEANAAARAADIPIRFRREA